ncbi:hypothetical protein POTOM_056781 [Populus tomentosa]|uniref:Uncharacterized protein n=1 Tax=Populus tomentosa TaxID=118781 RepID=A0A8X8C4B7_POPTO|nr:hypothetical protein POTOM_056781 [Populus tomentosa]
MFLRRPAAHEVPWERKSKGLHSHAVTSLGIYHEFQMPWQYFRGFCIRTYRDRFSFGTQFHSQLLRILDSSVGDESLWMSLGKCWDASGTPRAATAAWKSAEEKGLNRPKPTTICSGPGFSGGNSMATVSYLQGGK